MHDLALSIFAGISAVLALLSLPGPVRSRNIPVLINCLLLVACNLSVMVNTAVWWDKSDNIAPVFCDIAIRLQALYFMTIPWCGFCINRRLASIALSKRIAADKAAQKRSKLVELFLCIGVPLIELVIRWIVQPHRFDVWEGYGCTEAVWPGAVATVLVFLPPVIVSAASSIFGIVAIRFFINQRLQITSLLRAQSSGLDSAQYVRLIALASSDIVLVLPGSIYTLVRDASNGIPWTSFADVHFDWSRVDSHPAFGPEGWFVSVSQLMGIAFTKWCIVLGGMLCFIFFGTSEDSLHLYLWAFSALETRLSDTLRIRSQSKASQSASAVSKHSELHRPQLGTTLVNGSGQRLEEVDFKAWSPDKATAAETWVMESSHGRAISVKVERETV